MLSVLNYFGEFSVLLAVSFYSVYPIRLIVLYSVDIFCGASELILHMYAIREAKSWLVFFKWAPHIPQNVVFPSTPFIQILFLTVSSYLQCVSA